VEVNWLDFRTQIIDRVFVVFRQIAPQIKVGVAHLHYALPHLLCGLDTSRISISFGSGNHPVFQHCRCLHVIDVAAQVHFVPSRLFYKGFVLCV